MKFGIITHYDVHNHGAVLQLYALIQILKNKGIQANALQFDKNYDFLGVELKSKYEISLKSFGFYIKYFVREGLAHTLYNIRKRKILNLFKARNSLIGDYYSQVNDIDAMVVGSDEVFALHTGPTPIMFGHARPAKFVFSYAGSFGPTVYEDIVSKNCIEFVASGLRSMSGISVRDKNSFDIVMELIGREPKIVCDPVILYGYEKEIDSARPPGVSNYLLVYAYDNRMNDKDEIIQIKKFAKKHRLKIVSPGFYHKWCDINANVNPLELLSYFKYAKYIITDTFHGTVMSIITRQQFVVKTRDNGNKLLNLLEEFGLRQRVSDSLLDLEEKFNHLINYNDVDCEIRNRKSDSMRYLEEMINSAYEYSKRQYGK